MSVFSWAQVGQNQPVYDPYDSVAKPLPPNIYLILDVSGSMSSPGYSQDSGKDTFGFTEHMSAYSNNPSAMYTAKKAIRNVMSWNWIAARYAFITYTGTGTTTAFSGVTASPKPTGVTTWANPRLQTLRFLKGSMGSNPFAVGDTVVCGSTKSGVVTSRSSGGSGSSAYYELSVSLGTSEVLFVVNDMIKKPSVTTTYRVTYMADNTKTSDPNVFPGSGCTGSGTYYDRLLEGIPFNPSDPEELFKTCQNQDTDAGGNLIYDNRSKIIEWVDNKFPSATNLMNGVIATTGAPFLKELTATGSTPIGETFQSVRKYVYGSPAAATGYDYVNRTNRTVTVMSTQDQYLNASNPLLSCRYQAVVVLTDGRGNCPDAGTGEASEVSQAATSKTSFGLNTFIIGFGTQSAGDQALLDRVADMGQTDPTEPANPCGTTPCNWGKFRPFFADDDKSLEEAFRAIVNGIESPEFSADNEPILGFIQPSLVPAFVNMPPDDWWPSYITDTGTTVYNGVQNVMIKASTGYSPVFQGHVRMYQALKQHDATDKSKIDFLTDFSQTKALWDAADKLNTRLGQGIARNIYTFTGSTRIPVNLAYQSALESLTYLDPTDDLSTSDINESVVDFINWVNNQPFGAITYSTPAFVSPPDPQTHSADSTYVTWAKTNTVATRPRMVIVGANDGMLHCLNAVTGEELWAVIPEIFMAGNDTTYPKLFTSLYGSGIPDQQGQPNVSGIRGQVLKNRKPHHYFVASSPQVYDIQDGTTWKTICVFGLGGGGRKYYCLDITDPADPKYMWELNDSRLGETWSVPGLGQAPDGTYLGAFGSGFYLDGTEAIGQTLFLIDLASGSIITSFDIGGTRTVPDPPPGFPNLVSQVGNCIFAPPVVFDSHGDEDDYINKIYFTDYDGNVYRIDLSGVTTFTELQNVQCIKIFTNLNHTPIYGGVDVSELELPDSATPLTFITFSEYGNAVDTAEFPTGVQYNGVTYCLIEENLGTVFPVTAAQLKDKTASQTFTASTDMGFLYRFGIDEAGLTGIVTGLTRPTIFWGWDNAGAAKLWMGTTSYEFTFGIGTAPACDDDMREHRAISMGKSRSYIFDLQTGNYFSNRAVSLVELSKYGRASSFHRGLRREGWIDVGHGEAWGYGFSKSSDTFERFGFKADNTTYRLGLVAIITGPTDMCIGDSVTLDAGAGFATYLWSTGADTQTITVSPSAITDYTVTVTDDLGHSTTSAVHTVAVHPHPTVTISGATELCAGDSITLDAGAGFTTYLWSTGAATRTITVSPSSTTTYSVTVTNEFGCSASSAAHTVTVHPRPAVAVTGPTEVCTGDSVMLDAGAGFVTYLWSTGDVTRTITISPSSTTSYTVTVTNEYGCPATSTAHTLTVNPRPTVTIAGPIAVCLGGSVTLDAGPGFATYLWSTGAVTRTITVSPSSTTQYVVTVTNGSGCAAVSAAHTVTVNPTPAVTVSGPTEVCAGDSVTLVAEAGFTTYLWSTGAVSQTITVSPSLTASYAVTVTNEYGCATTSLPHTVTVYPRPAVTINGPTAVCAGNSVTLDAGAGFTTYQWSTGATTRTIMVSPSSTTGYTVVVTNGFGCPASSAVHTVTVYPRPVVTISGPEQVCAGDSVILDAGSGYATYLWSTGAVDQTITASPNSTTAYSVTVTNEFGCPAAPAVHVVTVNPRPVVTITGSTDMCVGENVTLGAGAGFTTYLWSTGATTQTITVSPSSTTGYTVAVTNDFGCPAISVVHTVTVHPRPTVTIAGPTETCVGNSATLDAGGGFATYLWSTGATAQTITVSPSSTTSYSVTATNEFGCSAEAPPHTVTVFQLPIITLEPQSLTICRDGSTTLTVSATGSEPLHYQWFEGTTPVGTDSPTLATGPLPATAAYTVRVSNMCGADDSATATIIVQQPPTVTVEPQNQTICRNETATLSVTATGTAPIHYQWYEGSTPVGTDNPSFTTPALTVDATYHVHVTNMCGTGDSISATIIVQQPPTVIVDPQPQSICRDESATLTVTATGTEPLHYQWYEGTTSVGIDSSSFMTPPLSADATYYVHVSNICGSADSAAVTMTVRLPPTVTVDPQNQTICRDETATLTVIATGAVPLHYQWYEGTTPVGTDNPSFTTPALTANATYYVHISNICGTADSAAVTITVQQSPTVTVDPQNQTICRDESATLTVTATGTEPLHYQWYAGTTSVGIDSSSFMTPPLSADATYTVHVTNMCGSADSASASITVRQPPEVTVNPAGQTICSGETATLTVTAAGTEPLHYQWYQGAVGDISIPVGTDSLSYTTGPLSATVAFWVRLTNMCGTDDSVAVTVDVRQTEIVQQPVSLCVPNGAIVPLMVEVSGVDPTFQWYEGPSGDESQPLAGAIQAEILVGPLSTGFYEFWVKVTDGPCTVSSLTAEVEANNLTDPDLNLDGVVNWQDVSLMADFLSGRINGFLSGLCVADLNLDGTIDAVDLTLMLLLMP